MEGKPNTTANTSNTTAAAKAEMNRAVNSLPHSSPHVNGFRRASPASQKETPQRGSGGGGGGALAGAYGRAVQLFQGICQLVASWTGGGGGGWLKNHLHLSASVAINCLAVGESPRGYCISQVELPGQSVRRPTASFSLRQSNLMHAT